MRYSSRFFLYGPFVMLVALAAGIMLYWWHAATALSQRLDALNGHEIAPGVHMRFVRKKIAGFPFRLDVLFDNFTLDVDAPRGPLEWHTDALATHSLTYSSGVTVFEAAGTQTLSWTTPAGAHRALAFQVGALRASAVVEDSKLARFDLDAISLAAPKFAAGRAQFHLRRDPAYDALDLVFDLQSVRFAGDAAEGFAHGLSRVRLDGRLAPTTAFEPLLAGKTTWRPALLAWQQGSGAFKVDQAAAFWEKCEATSSGVVALDTVHRLKGSLDFSLADCGALSKQAAGAGATRGPHRPILIVLSDLAAREPADKTGALPVTLVFKDGIIFVGPGKTLATGSTFEPVAFLHALY